MAPHCFCRTNTPTSSDAGVYGSSARATVRGRLAHRVARRVSRHCGDRAELVPSAGKATGLESGRLRGARAALLTAPFADPRQPGIGALLAISWWPGGARSAPRSTCRSASRATTGRGSRRGGGVPALSGAARAVRGQRPFVLPSRLGDDAAAEVAAVAARTERSRAARQARRAARRAAALRSDDETARRSRRRRRRFEAARLHDATDAANSHLRWWCGSALSAAARTKRCHAGGSCSASAPGLPAYQPRRVAGGAPRQRRRPAADARGDGVTPR